MGSICVLRVLALEGCPEFFCFDGLLKNSEAFLKEASSSKFGHRFGETGDLGGNLYIVKAIDDALGYFYEISEALCAFESYLKRGRRAPGGYLPLAGSGCVSSLTVMSPSRRIRSWISRGRASKEHSDIFVRFELRGPTGMASKRGRK